MKPIELTAERGQTHGNFLSNGHVSQALKNAMRGAESWRNCNPCQREALEMIATKISRILSGHPGFRDHWADIAGYAQLIADQCEEQPRPMQAGPVSTIGQMLPPIPRPHDRGPSPRVA